MKQPKRRLATKKRRLGLVRAASEDESNSPSSSVIVPVKSTRHHVLPSGLLGSVYQVLSIPEPISPTADLHVTPADDPALWNDEPHPRLEELPDLPLDPAYIEELGAGLVTARRKRVYVNLPPLRTGPHLRWNL